MTAPSDGVDEMLALAQKYENKAVFLEGAHVDEADLAQAKEYRTVAAAIRASARPAVDGGAAPGRDAILSLLDLLESNLGSRPLDMSGHRRSILLHALRLAAKPSDPDTLNTRRAEEDARLVERVRHECADIAAQYNDCSGDFIAEKIRDAATNLSSTGERKP